MTSSRFLYELSMDLTDYYRRPILCTEVVDVVDLLDTDFLVFDIRWDHINYKRFAIKYTDSISTEMLLAVVSKMRSTKILTPLMV